MLRSIEVYLVKWVGMIRKQHASVPNPQQALHPVSKYDL